MNFPIEYFLCSDLKFLAIICGIESATCNHACIWCKCPASERHNMKAEWSFTGNGARTISEIQICCKQPKAKRFNCTNMPLFPSIPIDHTIVDILHLFLRVTDVLFNLLIIEVRRKDAVVKCMNESSLRDGCDNLYKLESFLRQDCHIPFRFFYCKDTKDIKWRDLMGPEKLVVFTKINLPNLLPDLPNVDAIQLLWKKFKSLYDMLHGEAISFSGAVRFEEEARKWVNDFTKIYQTKHVTPHMHILALHVPEFLKCYGNLITFTQ